MVWTCQFYSKCVKQIEAILSGLRENVPYTREGFKTLVRCRRQQIYKLTANTRQVDVVVCVLRWDSLEQNGLGVSGLELGPHSAAHHVVQRRLARRRSSGSVGVAGAAHVTQRPRSRNAGVRVHSDDDGSDVCL